MIRPRILRQACLHAGERFGLTPTQTDVARRVAIQRRQRTGRIVFLVQREQFGLVVHAVRVDAFPEFIEWRHGGRRR